MKKLSLVAIAATLAFAAPVSATETVANPTVSTQAAAAAAGGFGGMSIGATIATVVAAVGVVAAVADSTSGSN